MASSACISPHPLLRCGNKKTLSFTHPLYLSSSKSFLKLGKQSFLSSSQFGQLRIRRNSSFYVVYAAQSNFVKVLQTAYKVGKDGIEAGTNLVPDSIPRPIARIATTVVALAVSLFVLKSFLSTAFFVLATMGLVYFIFIALNKDKGPRGGEDGGGRSGETTSTEDTLEEARRIMEKYK